MNESEVGIMSIAISWLFLAYFVILFAERLQSLLKIGFAGFFNSGFDGYVNVMTIVSLLATVVLLAFFNKGFWTSLFSRSTTPDYLMLSVTAGVILLSGMVHTEHTIAPIQFGAYGALILAMILRTIQIVGGTEHPFHWWYSLIFVVILSMAIPVVYPTSIESSTLFYFIEAIVSVALVVCFTVLLVKVMTGQGANLLWLIPVLIVAVGDTIVLAMRWKENVNSFVLIFGSLSVLVYLVGKLIVRD